MPRKTKPRDANETGRLTAEQHAAVLDAIPAHVALLDHNGVIMAVNEAWRRFASANVLQSADFFVGQNYIGICERAHGECADEAQAVATGIRKVLSGEAKDFGIEYPCHSPNEQRWYRLMVTPLSETPRAGAVVMHVDVTPRRLAEEELRQTEREQRQLAEKLAIETRRLRESQAVANVGSWETDFATLTVTWTEETHRIFETNPEEFEVTHRGFLDRVHPDDRERVDAAFAASIGERGPFAIEHRLVMPDGRIKIVEERWQTFRDVTGKPDRAVGTCQDITTRKQADRTVVASEASLARAQRVARTGNWDWNIVTGELHWSAQIFELFGIDPANAPGTYERFINGVHPEDRERAHQAVMDAVEGRAPYDIEHRVLWPDGTVRVMHELGEVTRDEAGRALNMVGTVQDITERKRSEELVHIRVRQQEAIAKIGFEATRATALEPLFDFAMQEVASALGVELCKILQLAPDGSHLRLVSGVGWQPGLLGVGIVGVDRESQAGFTLMSNETIYVNDFAKETRFTAPPLLTQHQVVSGLSVTIPLRDKPWGVLGAHSRTVRQFNGPDAGFMHTVAALLSMVVERLAVERTLTESEARMRDAQRIAHLGNWELDIAKDELTWSEEVFRIFGVDPAGLPATNDAFLALVHPDDREAMEAAQDIALSGRGPLEIEHRIIRGDGAIRFVRERGELIRDEGGLPVALVGTMLDITERKQAEEERSRVFNLSMDLLAIASFDGQLEQVNPAWTECLGWSAEELTSQPWLDFVHPDDHAATIRAGEAITSGTAVRDFENRYRCKDGSHRWLSWACHPLMESRQMFCAARDVTERRANEAQLRLLETCVSRLNDIVLITEAEPISDPGPRILYVNDAFVHRTGFTREEVIGKTPRILQGPKTQRDALDRIRDALNAWKPVREELINYTKAGEEFWLELDIVPIADATGWFTHWVAIERDITERKRIQEVLADSQRQYRDLVDTSYNVIWSVDMEGRFTFLNQASRAVFGRAPEEMVGRRFHDFVPEDQHQANDEIFAQLFRNGQDVIDYSNRIRRADGSIAILNSNARVMLDAQGQRIGVSGMSQDTTESVRAQEAIAQSEARFRGLFDQAAVGMCLVSSEGDFLRTNARFCEIVGYSPAELLQRTCIATTHPDEREMEAQIVARILAGELPSAAWEKRYVHREGHAVWCNLTLSLLPGANGQPAQLVGVIEDISERRSAVEQLRHREQLLGIAGKVAKLGGWSVDFPEVRINWSDEVCAIHDMPSGTVPTLEQGLGFYSPESRPVIESAFALCVSEGTPFDLELEVLTAKGRRITVRTIGQAERDEAGTIRRVQGAFQDISEQKAAEVEIRELGGRLVNTLETITDAFFTLDRDWKFTYLNAEAEKLLVRDRASLLGRNIWHEFPAGVGSPFQRHYERAFAEMESVSFEEHFAPLSKWFEVRAFPSTDGLAVYFHDVTALRESREALAASEMEFRNLAEAMPQIVWITRPDGWTIYFNQNWMDYTGLTLEESLGHGWNEPFHPEDRQRAWDAWQIATATVGTYTLECRLRRADGEYRWWLIRGEPQRDADGNVVKWFGTCTDIHSLKIAELEITRTNRALKMLSACNEALIHAVDEGDLLKVICEIAVASGGYQMAWVGFAQDDAQRTIQPMAYAGEEAGYLSDASISWAENTPDGSGPGGRTIRTGQPQMSEDMEQDDGFHWREVARQRGYRSVICLPLRSGDRTFGLLGLYSAEVLQIRADELKLLQELADDLAFGIQTLRLRIEGQKMQRAVLAIARGVSSTVGEEFFATLVRHTMEALHADAGFVAEMLPGKPPRARTIAAMVDGKTIENFDYGIAGTPCVHLLADDECVVADRVAELFPNGSTLASLGAKAYVGRRLTNAAGEKIGLIFVLFREPLKETAFITSTLRIFAARATSELERQKSDQQLREQAALLDAAHDAILVRDLEGHVLYWNKGAERLYGWTPDEAIGRQASTFLYGDLTEVKSAEQEVLKTDRWEGELLNVGKDGSTILVQASWTLLRDAAGRPTSVLAINSDLTEKKKLEAQFLRAQRMESIGTLAGGIAHDLNNVLAPIMMSVEMLKLTAQSEEDQELLATVSSSAQRGANLVSQVLGFARGVVGQRIPVNVGHLIREFVSVMRDTFPKNLTVESTSSATLWSVIGDPTQVHQVILNLCVNARDAMPNGGTLTIGATNIVLDDAYVSMNLNARTGSYVVVTVEDSGTGIPPEVLERVFEPFFTTKETGKGTGLGLSTIAAIMKSHGGFINVYSEVGRGTTFRVYFPADASQTASDEQSIEQTRLPRGHGELILVVDDEESIRNVAKRTLERFGYSVMVAENGAEAVALYGQHQSAIAVIITDMAMPIMDGPTMITALLSINPAVRIIGSSGLSSLGGGAMAVGAGVTQFIAKPYTAEELLKSIRAILDAR